MGELEPLDPEIVALLERAKPIEEIDAGRRAAILENVTHRLELPLPPSGTLVEGGKALTTHASRILAFVAVFGAGVGTGLALAPHRAASPAPVVRVVEAPAPPVSVEVPAAPVTSASSETPMVREPASPREPPSRHAEVPSARGLAGERALLDVARSALARGEAGQAFAAVERHSREYPNGALAEEREAMAVRALVALGRTDEARTRAVAFERTFPGSLNLRGVKGAAFGSRE